MAVPIFAFIALSLILFGLGLAGVLLRRNGLSIVLSVQLLFAGCYLALATFAAVHDGDGGAAADGRISSLLAATAAVAQAVVTLSLLVNFRQQSQTVDVESADQLKW